MFHAPRRLFVGLIPPRPLQAAIGRHARGWQWPQGARPTRFGRYHLTLHFLGEVPTAHENRLRAALREVPWQPFELRLARAQLWRQGIAVLQPEPHAALDALHAHTQLAVRRAGLQAGRAFTPHLTLARDAAEALPPPQVQPLDWEVHRFVLVWSLLPPQAKPARYEIVESFGPRGSPGGPLAPSGHPGEQLSFL